MEGIRFAIEELHALTETIRKASIRNEDLSLDAAFIKDDTTDFKNHMLPIIRRMFPHAQPSLCDQLALSVAIRRRRLRRTFKDAEKLRARRARSARSQSNNNQESPASAIPSQPSQPQPQLLYTLARLPHNVEGGITCTESVVTRNKLNVGVAYSDFQYGSAPSAKSMGSSVCLSTCKSPPNPHFPPGTTDCICPYCAEKVSTAFLSRHPKIWKYVFASHSLDFQPYIF